ncbi:MAG: hypothetical protein ACKPKO_52145, partial [Candidatus Fonsibacter sp.]
PENQVSIYDGYSVADALGLVIWEMYNKVWQANVHMKSDIYGANMASLNDVGDQDAGPAPDNFELYTVFITSCPRTSTSRPSTLSMWLVFWT